MSEVVRRLERLRSSLRSEALDGLVVSAPSSIFYLSGFREYVALLHGSSAALLVTAERQILVSDFRYRLQAKEQAPGFEFVEIERKLFATAGAEAANSGVKRLGYDPAHLTCELRDQLAGAAEGVELAPQAGLVEALRAVKSPGEVRRIAEAAALADRALAHMLGLVRPGAKERDIALEGEFLMRRQGAEAAAFDIIVASGPRSALPHAATSDRALEAGELVIIDIGARVAGYCSDMTRTFAVEHATDKASQIYSIVQRAQRAAAAQVRPGAVCGELDRVARSLIEEAGHGDEFGHALGHGVGIDFHERPPRLGKGEETKLVAGNVVTVEPGIYLDGFGGVRLEDLMVVTEDGADTLTGAPMAPELPVVGAGP